MYFKIKFEGLIFIATVDHDGDIIVTARMIQNVNTQLFFHLRQRLQQDIADGSFVVDAKELLKAEQLEINHKKNLCIYFILSAAALSIFTTIAVLS